MRAAHPIGISLAELLVARRQIRCNHYAPRLTIPQVLAWADAHRARTGRWPTCAFRPLSGGAGRALGFADLSNQGRTSRPAGRYHIRPVTDQTPGLPQQRLRTTPLDSADPRPGRMPSTPKTGNGRRGSPGLSPKSFHSRLRDEFLESGIRHGNGRSDARFELVADPAQVVTLIGNVCCQLGQTLSTLPGDPLESVARRALRFAVVRCRP